MPAKRWETQRSNSLTSANSSQTVPFLTEGKNEPNMSNSFRKDPRKTGFSNVGGDDA
jgi:hypothetical protein